MLLFGAVVRADGEANLRIEVFSDDGALARAVVRSARKQVRAEVEAANASAFNRPSRRRLTLQVQREPGGVNVVLAGAEGRVQRLVPLAGAPNPLDVAEAVALLLPELLARLESQRAPPTTGRTATPAKAEAHAAPSPPSLPPPAIPPPTPPIAIAPAPLAPPSRPPSRPPSLIARTPPPAAAAFHKRDEPLATPRVLWLLSAVPGVMLGRGGLTAPGIDIAAEISSGGRIGWFGRLSVGAYPVSLGNQEFAGLSIYPLAAVIGARLKWWRGYSSLGIGGELLIAAEGGDSGEVSALTFQADSGLHLSRRVVLGVRLTGSFASGTNQLFVSTGQQVSVPNLFLRGGLFVGVELP